MHSTKANEADSKAEMDDMTGESGSDLTMKAVVQHRYGGPEVLGIESVERPTPGEGEVLLRVRAAGVDRGTWHLMAGLPYLVRFGFGLRRPKQPVPGLDVAGTVEAVGAGVSRFALGDEVFGFAKGSLAEYAVAPEEKLSHQPAEVSFEQAAVSAVSGITALQAVEDVAGVREAQRVLVLGASGGVGSFAVQIAKAAGAHVTGVASGSKADFVRGLGADEVIDYRTEDFTETTGRYDAIIDTGGRHSIRRLRSVLAPEGTLVIVGGEGGNKLTGGFGRPIRAAMMSPFVGHSMPFFLSTEHHDFIDRLAGHMAGGEVVPAVGQEFPLEQTPEAIRRLAAGESSGKSAILVSAL
jgi:NADPH:quinone reductase-like Zn-dependent oxidoreductase